jgi:hypothetical protein
VKVTDVPAQTVVTGVVIVTAGVTVDRIMIGIAPDVATAGDIQLALEVITQETDCPLVRELVV